MIQPQLIIGSIWQLLYIGALWDTLHILFSTLIIFSAGYGVKRNHKCRVALADKLYRFFDFFDTFSPFCVEFSEMRMRMRFFLQQDIFNLSQKNSA